ncbi:MAG: OpgC domain-containing protein [Candidatus Saccharimonadales bacterium]
MSHTISPEHRPHQPNKRRIHELDFLRGFFIIVIIIDHVQRWPNPLSYLTGEGRLWVSAAEGFFIISGLLIGYLRGRKGLKQSFHTLSRMLIRRAAKLYLWSVIVTFIAVIIMQFAVYDPQLLPKLPDTSGLTYIWQVLTQQYVFDWIYFLRLYWMMLLVAPLAILAFRCGRWWLVPIASTSVYALSLTVSEPEAALQWQFLFFMAATIGWHFETILDYIRARPRLKTIIMFVSIGTMISTMILSYFWVLGWERVESGQSYFSRDAYVSVRSWLDIWFTKDPLAVGRVALSFIWFTGLLSLMHLVKPLIERYLRWLLTPLGTYSLTAYTLQSLALIPVQLFVPTSTIHTYNLLIALGAVVAIRFLTTQRYVHRLLPQ